MSDISQVLGLATLAGITIPIGGFLARIEHLRPRWLETELRHSVIAFGGGALIAAVALVLVPIGSKLVPPALALAAFGGGGILTFVLTRLIEQRGNSFGQFAAMLLDYVPESLALGAMLAVSRSSGLLLALLIGAQNLPEAFNAYRELAAKRGHDGLHVLIGFCALVPFGPLLAWFGYVFLREMPQVLGTIMLAAAGGILYLTFQDIAPQARLRRHWGPPLGAVAGFMLGLAGDMLVRGGG